MGIRASLSFRYIAPTTRTAKSSILTPKIAKIPFAETGWLETNLLITGPTEIGKSFLACAFVERACRRGFTGCYVRASRLVHDLGVARGDGSYVRLLSRLAKVDLLAIDDWLLHPLKDADRRDLMEVIEERAERGSTLIATQLPVKQWHTAIGDPNHADALCDRILHRAHRITLKGASLRKTKSAPETTTGDT